MFTRSRDQGASWTTPVPVNDTPNERSVFNPAIAVTADGQHVSILYCDKRHDDGSGRWIDLYLAEPFDGGDAWEPSLRVSEVSSDLNLAPLTPAGRMLGDYHGLVPALDFDAPGLGIWVDTRASNPDPFVATIARTRGSAFESWRRLAFDASELADPARSGAGADVERDGLPNLVEYALGLSPRERDGNPFDVADEPPLVVMLEQMNAATDVEWIWLASPDLGVWSPAEPAAVQAVPASEPVLTRWRFRFDAGGPHRFLVPGARLRAGP